VPALISKQQNHRTTITTIVSVIMHISITQRTSPLHQHPNDVQDRDPRPCTAKRKLKNRN